MPHVPDDTPARAKLLFEQHEQLVVEGVGGFVGEAGQQDIYVVDTLRGLPAPRPKRPRTCVGYVPYITRRVEHPPLYLFIGAFPCGVVKYPPHRRDGDPRHFSYLFKRHNAPPLLFYLVSTLSLFI